ncbi:MAG: TlpA family protein disulfide reductase [Alphaproteobacteria bacterium]
MMKRISALLAILFAAFAIGTAAQADTNDNLGFMEWDAAAAEEAVINGERVIINTWATWCPFCKAQRRALSSLLKSDPETYGDVKVFAVDIDDPNTPSRIGSKSVSKTTMIFFIGCQEIVAFKGQDTMEMAAFLNAGQ